MNLAQLINYLNTKAVSTSTDEAFFVFGRYGYVRATPQKSVAGLIRFTIDSIYKNSSTKVLIQQQDGFRLSTLCCLCAGILYGENALDRQMINTISAQL